VNVWAAWERYAMKTRKKSVARLMMGFAVSKAKAVYLFGNRPQAKGEQMIYSRERLNILNIVDSQALKA
jgi:hypothetical protein